MSKPTKISRAASGVFEAARDLFGIYAGDSDDDTVAILAVQANELAALDSTTAALGSNGTWTSGVVKTNGFGRIVGSVFANQAGTLHVQQSSDGENWDVDASVSVTASTGASFSEEVVAPFARLHYVNGASAQGTFRLYGWLRRHGTA